jgi:hypothetical protein
MDKPMILHSLQITSGWKILLLLVARALQNKHTAAHPRPQGNAPGDFQDC